MNRPHFSPGGPMGPAAGSPASSWSVSPATGTQIENLRRLMNQRQQLSDARITELRDKVARGDYLTRQAALQTATCLLDENFDLP